ncbi:MAG: alkaline phosphatase family protein [Thalassobaculales bacterium]
MPAKVLIVVFDGLRPDRETADGMPHLRRFLDEGCWFADARTVFPSETRVAAASLVTGCQPARHGIAANIILDPALPQPRLNTYHGERLAAAGPELLRRPGLATLLAAAGRRMEVVSTASTGATWLLAPAGAHRYSVHGPAHSAPDGHFDAVTARIGPVPPAARPNTARIDHAVRVLIEDSYPLRDPDLAILWFSDPDGTWHFEGIDTPAGRAALAGADAAFGRVLDFAAARGLTLFALSDHGHITARHRIDLAAAFREAGFPSGERDLVASYSGGARIADPAVAESLAGWLAAQPWCGLVFSDPRGGRLPEGCFDRAAVGLGQPRATDVIWTLAAEGEGCTYADPLPVGGGIHGGLRPGELNHLLALAGPGIRPGRIDGPAGIVDVAPTVLHLLELPASGMDGRVLAEALAAGAAAPPAREEVSAAGRQRLREWRIGRHRYLAEAWRE